MKLCCYFNYPPLYRKAIYQAIDRTFDTQFYFGEEVEDGNASGIAKIDFSIFRKRPVEFKNKTFLHRFGWRTKSWNLAFKNYDAFIITGDFMFSYIPLLLFTRLMGKRVYGWGHGLKTLGKGFRPLNIFFYKFLNGYFTYSEGGKNRLGELGIDTSKVHVIYNSLSEGIDENVVRGLKSDIYSEHFGNTLPILIFIGRLTPQKKLDKLIYTLQKLNEGGTGCNLVFVGTGSESDKLSSLTEELGIDDHVWFFGECYDENTNGELLYNADLCISPGNVGLTALHAMSYGLPVISHSNFETQMPEYETIVPGLTGDLFEEGNLDDLFVKVKDWITNNISHRVQIRDNCFNMINGNWNSGNQLKILQSVLKANV